ncbi:MAG: ABC transporter ATP-binding protein [Gammaproteobacteria bacterium]|nr:ABC transporter ATP-binding protein [Gammaproteobacteria bacterium]NIR83120.1 ABC transporter ATP-binding protein [Gammaproteobacteria bacterium]NIR90782.1 ABC transporter ATP-binding protein [Gammaproteobacteria bacterium]NIU04273.1 ABC transporter ATP-binding protein [Gammaproteobacteria bacterium]NIV51565.1 ATP-binding cassette domain-containing protein [Gammaproteobacteria bacterium]
MLEVRELSVRYGDAIAVDDLSIDVGDAEWVSLIGPNGAGKSSVIKAILGLLRHGGHVRMDGRDLSPLPSWERHRLGLAYAPEGRRLFPELSVEENLHVGAYGLSPEQVHAGMEETFQLFPQLEGRRRQAARTLSGGEQQMVALGRALVSRPKLLLVDEASLGLMPLAVHAVFEALAQLHAEGRGILLVEQNAKKALKYVDRAYVMEVGRVVLADTADVIARDPRVIESYVG